MLHRVAQVSAGLTAEVAAEIQPGGGLGAGVQTVLTARDAAEEQLRLAGAGRLKADARQELGIVIETGDL